MADDNNQVRAIPKHGFSEESGLRTWLETQDETVSVMIASRSAARSIPDLLGIASKLDDRHVCDLALSMFRAIAICRVMWMWPGQERFRFSSVSHTAGSAISRARAGAGSVVRSDPNANSAADSAGAAVRSASNSRGSVALSAASSGGSSANSLGWRQITRDAREFQQHGLRPLHHAPLWYAVGATMKDEALVNLMLGKWSQLKTIFDSREGENWQVWTDWYEEILLGRQGLSSMKDLENARIMEIRDRQWAEGAIAVNASLKGIIERFKAETVDDRSDALPLDVSDEEHSGKRKSQIAIRADEIGQRIADDPKQHADDIEGFLDWIDDQLQWWNSKRPNQDEEEWKEHLQFLQTVQTKFTILKEHIRTLEKRSSPALMRTAGEAALEVELRMLDFLRGTEDGFGKLGNKAPVIGALTASTIAISKFTGLALAETVALVTLGLAAGESKKD